MGEIYGFTHSVRTFLTSATQMYGFTHCLCTFRARAGAAHGAIAMEDLEDRRQWQARECVQRNRRQLNAQQRNERITVTGDDLRVSAPEQFTLLANSLEDSTALQ